MNTALGRLDQLTMLAIELGRRYQRAAWPVN
jgi:hypothetical protein